MRLTKTIFTITLTSLSVSLMADDIHKPEFFGYFSTGAIVDEGDFESEAYELELGLKGLFKLEGYVAAYTIITDISDAINVSSSTDTSGEGDIHVREASVVFPSNYGVLVLAPRGISGQYLDLYGPVQQFEYNEAHSQTSVSAGALLEQPDEGQNVIAYASPEKAGFQFIAATLQVAEDNDETFDVIATRILYKQDNWNLGIGRVIVNQAVASASDDYKRDALSISYQGDALAIGAVYEMNNDTFADTDSNVLGLTSTFKLTDTLSTSLGYFNKDYQLASTEDETLFIANVKKTLAKGIEVWAETGQYKNGQDNYALGVNLTL